jgi:hypothetical protein
MHLLVDVTLLAATLSLGFACGWLLGLRRGLRVYREHLRKLGERHREDLDLFWAITALRRLHEAESGEKCGFVAPTPGYAPCTREKGHDGPCAHDLADPAGKGGANHEQKHRD